MFNLKEKIEEIPYKVLKFPASLMIYREVLYAAVALLYIYSSKHNLLYYPKLLGAVMLIAFFCEFVGEITNWEILGLLLLFSIIFLFILEAFAILVRCFPLFFPIAGLHKIMGNLEEKVSPFLFYLFLAFVGAFVISYIFYKKKRITEKDRASGIKREYLESRDENIELKNKTKLLKEENQNLIKEQESLEEEKKHSKGKIRQLQETLKENKKIIDSGGYKEFM